MQQLQVQGTIVRAGSCLPSRNQQPNQLRWCLHHTGIIGNLTACQRCSPSPAHSRTASRPRPQVKLRPVEPSLRDIHAALDKIHCGSSSDSVDGAQAAVALQALLQCMAPDKGGSATGRAAVVMLTDRLYEAEDFRLVIQVS